MQRVAPRLIIQWTHAWSSRSLQLESAAVRAEPGMNRRNTLYSPKKERNLVMVRGACRLRIASIRFELTSRGPRLMIWPKCFMKFLESQHLRYFRFTAASFNNFKTCHSGSISSSGHLENMVIWSIYISANWQLTDDNMIHVARWNGPRPLFLQHSIRGNPNSTWCHARTVSLRLFSKISPYLELLSSFKVGNIAASSRVLMHASVWCMRYYSRMVIAFIFQWCMQNRRVLSFLGAGKFDWLRSLGLGQLGYIHRHNFVLISCFQTLVLDVQSWYTVEWIGCLADKVRSVWC